MQQNSSRPSNKAAPSTDPMTIPAICPPVRPWCSPLSDAGRAEELLPPVDDGNKSGKEDVLDGNTTPVHLSVTLELEQQGSVAFGELDAQ